MVASVLGPLPRTLLDKKDGHYCALSMVCTENVAKSARSDVDMLSYRSIIVNGTKVFDPILIVQSSGRFSCCKDIFRRWRLFSFFLGGKPSFRMADFYACCRQEYLEAAAL